MKKLLTHNLDHSLLHQRFLTMVIQTSDSCNTLVSLHDGLKQIQSTSGGCGSPQVDEYRRTELLFPSDDFDDDEDCYFQKQADQPIYLPSSQPVDAFLKNIPQVMESCDELLANPPRRFTSSSPERVLYIAQGEVGHAVPMQCDVIVSDKATTCHILALRSETGDSLPLTSLTHIDSADYESSIRAMFSEHVVHHSQSFEEEKKCDMTVEDQRIQMEVHVVGGFDDEQSSSRKISCWLMDLLALIAEEEKDSIKVTLKTCAISSMNDTGHSCPIGRGLGIDLKTGEAFLAKVDEEVAGPSLQLRSARLWSNSREHKLSVIHTATSNAVRIDAFSYQPFEELDALMQLPDDIMLQYCSTSPNNEEDDFCTSIRSTLRFLRDQDCTRVFGPQVDQTLIFRRTGLSNTWRSTQ
jgi:hypothetical protein